MYKKDKKYKKKGTKLKQKIILQQTPGQVIELV